MWRRKKKFKPLDEIMVDHLLHPLPGFDYSTFIWPQPMRMKSYWWGKAPDPIQPDPMYELYAAKIKERLEAKKEQAARGSGNNDD